MASITRLKREATLNVELEYEPLDVRIATLEVLADFRVDKTTHSAFSMNHADGMSKVHFMAMNSTNAKEWRAAILRSAKESSLLDQRYTAGLLALPSAPLYSDKLLPDPPLLQLRWPGSREYFDAYLRIEAKKGFKHSGMRGRRSFKCVYLYADWRNKNCIARLMRVSGVHALYSGHENDGEFDILIEAEGKLKSSKIGGLKTTTRAWFRAPSSEMRMKWIALLRNAFELCTSPTVLATTDLEPAHSSRGSDLSMSTLDSKPSVGTIYRKPWERPLANPALSVSSSRSRTYTEPRDEYYHILMKRQREEEERQRQYELYNSQTYGRNMGIFSGYSMPFLGPMHMSMGMPLHPSVSTVGMPMIHSMVQPYPMGARSVHSANASPRTSEPRQRLRKCSSYENFDHSPLEKHRRAFRIDPTPNVLSAQSISAENEALGQVLLESHSIKQNFLLYLSENLEMQTDSSVPCVLLQEYYERWCNERSERPARPPEVRRWMSELGYTASGLDPAWQHVFVK
jgi:hypothetical protein